MKTQELIETLEERAFDEKKKDSGIYFSKTMGHIKLICYIEPNVEAEFISLYRWDNNDVKGTYNISIRDLGYTKDTVADLFKKTKEQLPQQIGLCVDTHAEIDRVIEYIF